jgi:hypothetical protein
MAIGRRSRGGVHGQLLAGVGSFGSWLGCLLTAGAVPLTGGPQFIRMTTSSLGFLRLSSLELTKKWKFPQKERKGNVLY